MSQPTRNKPQTETQLVRCVEQLIAARLPPRWSMGSVKSKQRRRADSVVEIVAPSGETVNFVMEAKRSLTPQSLLQATKQVEAFCNESGLTNPQPFVAASYLSPRSREILVAQGISYGDATGNLRLTADRPGLLVEVVGAEKDPWPDDQPLQKLGGRGAARAVRALLDFSPPYGIRELAQQTEVSTATLSRVVDLLAREALLTKDPKGGVVDVDWNGVIRRWSRDYEFRRSNNVTAYLEPRGLDALLAKLREAKGQYAVTGSVAAQSFRPIAPAKIATIYVPDATQAAQRLGLREADAGANVLLAEPYDPVVFERTRPRDDLVTVAPTQLAVDLLTGPGREPSMGDELLAWMKANEGEWRG